MLLRIVDEDKPRDVWIDEGDMFLLPGSIRVSVINYADCHCLKANTPHNPVRFADTFGLVIERIRPQESLGAHNACSAFSTISLFTDRLRWYCENPAHDELAKVQEEAFHVTDLGEQLKPYIERWMNDSGYRTCRCDYVNPPV